MRRHLADLAHHQRHTAQGPIVPRSGCRPAVSRARAGAAHCLLLMGDPPGAELLRELSIPGRSVTDEAVGEATVASRVPESFLGVDTLQLMVESVEEYAIYLMDEAGHIRSWNRGAELIKGYQKEQVLGR